MAKRMPLLVLIILILRLMGCDGEPPLAPRTNPYDLENPWGRDVASVNILTEKDGKRVYPSWSPDEKKIAYRYERRIYVMDATGTSVEELPPVSRHEWEVGPRWSPKDYRIAYLHHNPDDPLKNYSISIRDYPGPRSVPLADGPYKEGSLVWSPDGDSIACVQKGSIAIIDTTHRSKKILECDAPISTICDWYGSKLLVISSDKAYTVDVQTNRMELLPTGEKVQCGNAVWSIDGSKILYVIFDNSRCELWIMNADGKQRAAILTEDIDPHAKFIDSISWSDDGSDVLFVGSSDFYGYMQYICMARIKPRQQSD